MTPTIQIMATNRRPKTLEACLRRLWTKGGMSDVARPTIVYALDSWDKGQELSQFCDCDVKYTDLKPQIWLDFREQFLKAPSNQDFLFFEDDVTPSVNAVKRMAIQYVPEQYGILSFFDWRYSIARPGIFEMPKGDPLWGSQVLKIPARNVRAFQDIAEKNTTGKVWDIWFGEAARTLGLEVAFFSPSIFQHLGAGTSIWSPGQYMIVARNYAGDDWDAMKDWPMTEPIKQGFCDMIGEALFCTMHQEYHPGNLTCAPIVP